MNLNKSIHRQITNVPVEVVLTREVRKQIDDFLYNKLESFLGIMFIEEQSRVNISINIELLTQTQITYK